MSLKLRCLYSFFLLSFVLFYLFFIGNYVKIPLLGGIHSDMRVNTDGLGVVIADNVELSPSSNFENGYNVYITENYPIKSLYIKGKDVFVSLSDKLFYLGDYDGYFSKKYNDFSNNITGKGFFKFFQIKFLSIFYNSMIFLFIFFVLFWLTFLKSPPKFGILFILILSLILRLPDLSVSLWTDETYSLYMAGNSKLPFLSVFMDSGNPPLFFILVRFLEIFFGKSPEILRFFYLFTSVFSNYLIYLILKNETGKKEALFSSFLFSVNIYSIVSSIELRAYSLLIFLSLSLFYYLLKLQKTPTTKNFVIYGILGALILNTHYFGAIILFFNFLYGLFVISKKTSFIYANLISFLFFLPYLLYNGLNGLIDSGFNKFPAPHFKFYFDCFIKYSGGFISAFILFVFSIFALQKRDKIYLYSSLLIFGTFLFSYLFSLIKPICQEYYFILLLPFFIILMSYVFSFKNLYLKIFISILLLASYFSFNPYIPRDRHNFLNFDNIVSFYMNKTNGINSALIVPHSKDMVKIAYNLPNDIEIIQLNSFYSADNLIDAINETKSKEVYFKLEYKFAKEFLFKTSKMFKTSFIRVDNDVIIAKVTKERK